MHAYYGVGRCIGSETENGIHRFSEVMCGHKVKG